MAATNGRASYRWSSCLALSILWKDGLPLLIIAPSPKTTSTRWDMNGQRIALRGFVRSCPNLRRGNARYACRMSKNCSAMSIRRSEERRVGKECRSRWWREYEKKKEGKEDEQSVR